MHQSSMKRRAFLSGCVGSLVGGAVLPHWLSAEDEQQERVVWIYRDIPARGQPDRRTAPEVLFQPHFIYPADATSRVAINDRLNVSSIEKEGTGTCCEFAFRPMGSGWFAGVKFIPGGTQPGEREGIDVNRLLRLGEDLQTRVALQFKARTVAGAKVHVDFQVGGTSGRLHRDGLKFPETTDPSPAVVTEKWGNYTIDLTGKPDSLRSVICPLGIIVKSDDNPGAREITVFVDDVKFAVLPARK